MAAYCLFRLYFISHAFIVEASFFQHLRITVLDAAAGRPVALVFTSSDRSYAMALAFIACSINWGLLLKTCGK